MIHLTDEQLRKLQMVELEMLTELDRICRKNRIHYTLTGGTLLGAVRHGGFIPWDDDADVAMMRPEYEKFRKACAEDLDTERFYFQDIDNTAGYRWGYGKLRRKDSLFLRENQEHMPYGQGIFLDIFVRDGVPDGYIAERLHKFACFCVRKMLWSAVGRYGASSFLRRAGFLILYHCSKSWITDAYHGLVRISGNMETERVRMLTFPIPHGGKGYLRKWYEHYVDIEFEGRRFMAEAGYREWLAMEFHDYMAMPPAEEQKTHPVVAVRFPGECAEAV